ncbi:MAG TPA: type II toxin-antitoxin system PemK/MazF family toxin [Tepidisphaeraceae bacterium]
MQADNLNAGLSQTIVAMITSNMQRTGHPSRITVPLSSPAARMSGLKTDSVIMTDNLVTIHNREIDRTIGKWADWAALDAALRATLGIR